MKTAIDRAGASNAWRAQAAYLYVLDLDGPALAWEYLRRNAAYQAAWLAQGRGVDAESWGLRCS